MDFRQATQPTNSSRPSAPSTAPTSLNNKDKSPKRLPNSSKWFKTLNVIILLGIAILLAAIALAVARAGSDNEYKYVNSDKYQAVFLNNGQVYFGNIDNLNDQYVRLSNIYYLTQSSGGTGTSATTNSNYSLVKLGCQQIHDPLDEMIINRDQVTFWENLNDSGKVVTSIKQFQKQNPNGPDCSQVSNQTQASSNAGAQNTATPNNATTGTGSSTTDTNSTKQ